MYGDVSKLRRLIGVAINCKILIIKKAVKPAGFWSGLLNKDWLEIWDCQHSERV
jgi:hypothetical protein